MAEGDINNLRCMIGELWPHADLMFWRSFRVRLDSENPGTSEVMRLYVSRPARPDDEGWAEVPFRHPGITDPMAAAREAIMLTHVKRWEQAALGYNELTAPVGVPGNKNAENPHKALVLECLRETLAGVRGKVTKKAICDRALKKATDRLPPEFSREDLPPSKTVQTWLREMLNSAQTR